MYVDYKEITRRKIQAYEEDGTRYLIRAYFENGVDWDNGDNTYL